MRQTRRELFPVVAPIAAVMGMAGLSAVYLVGGQVDDLKIVPLIAIAAASVAFWMFYIRFMDGASRLRAAVLGAISPIMATSIIPPLWFIAPWTFFATAPWGFPMAVGVGTVTGLIMHAVLNAPPGEPDDEPEVDRRHLLRPPSEPWWRPDPPLQAHPATR